MLPKTESRIDTGIPEEKRKNIAQGLSRVLADTYTLYLKTQNFHWNVTGPHFNSLHLMFEEQYQTFPPAIDEIAERIRSLGAFTPGSFQMYKELSVVPESTEVPAAMEMVKLLLKDHEAIARRAREAFAMADDADDEATADLLTRRIEFHEKTAWMLRAFSTGQ